MYSQYRRNMNTRDAGSSGANLRLEECELLTKYYLRDGSVGNPLMVLKLIQEIKLWETIISFLNKTKPQTYGFVESHKHVTTTFQA